MVDNGFVLVAQTKVSQMADMIAKQAKQLAELEKQLKKEQESKANLEMDFQHAIEQMQLLATNDPNISAARNAL